MLVAVIENKENPSHLEGKHSCSSKNTGYQPQLELGAGTHPNSGCFMDSHNIEDIPSLAEMPIPMDDLCFPSHDENQDTTKSSKGKGRATSQSMSVPALSLSQPAAQKSRGMALFHFCWWVAILRD